VSNIINTITECDLPVTPTPLGMHVGAAPDQPFGVTAEHVRVVTPSSWKPGLHMYVATEFWMVAV